MAGMLEILTYLLCLYPVVKGVEVLQIALASTRPKRGGIIAMGAVTLVVCIAAAIVFAVLQTDQAESLSHSAGTEGQLHVDPNSPGCLSADRAAHTAGHPGPCEPDGY
jgi:hypothetical protein